VPIVLKLIPARTVVDVGCGDGAWLAVFREFGVTDTLGLDGDYVPRGLLQIPQDQFIAADLFEPFSLARTFDLAVSLEVAEHLPRQAAEGFVLSLTRLAPVVLFSAAIPFQTGTDHLNEQWPDYWAALFQQHDYLPIDCIRPRIWQNDQVEWWFAQNALLFAQAARIENDPILRGEFERTIPAQLCLVHPRKYLAAVQPLPPPGVRASTRLLTQALKRVALRAVDRLRPNHEMSTLERGLNPRG
jgi:SAM-dependent methyltransferase